MRDAGQSPKKVQAYKRMFIVTDTTALNLTPADPLDADIAAYFAKCEEKLGLIPNVLRAYSFD